MRKNLVWLTLLLLLLLWPASAVWADDPDRSTGGYEWNFDDGTSSPLANPTHAWAVAGIYDVALLAQKPQGMRISNGLLGGLGRLFGQQALRAYGFSPQDSPGIEAAGPLEPPEPRLEPHYVSLTSDQVAARQVLNPWVMLPLVDWAVRNPLQPARTVEDQAQMVILFSPQGVYLAGVGINTPQEIETLSSLGVELVRALGG